MRFGLVPHDERARELSERICARLSADVGATIEPWCASSPSALAEALASGDAHLAWSSPTLLLLSDEIADVIPLLSTVRQGVAFFHGILFVADDSPIRSLDDLRGKRVAWVARTSAAGYIFPRISLARAGYDVATLFAAETFYDAHGAVARAVFEDRADVGATFAVFEQGDPKRAMVNSGYRHAVTDRGARVIDAAGPIPSDLVVAMPSVPVRMRARIANALCKLADDTSGSALIRELMNAERFEPFSQTSFVELETLLKLGRLPGIVG